MRSTQDSPTPKFASFSWFSISSTDSTSCFSTLINDAIAEVTKYREDIQNKLAPYTESSTGQLSQDMQLLFNRLQKDMTDAKERSTAYVRELKSLIDQNGDDARNRMRTYTSKLKKRLDKDTEEIRK